MNDQRAGIYRVDCSASGVFYVGSTRNLRNRESQHRYNLRAGRKTNPGLAAAFRKFGEESLSFTVLAILEPRELVATEARLIAASIGDPLCCNVSPEVSGGGVPRSPETRAKIGALNRLAQLGRKHPHTEEMKEKMRRAALRRYGHEVTP